MIHTEPVTHRPGGGYREVMVLAFPIVLSMLSRTLMTAVDVAMLGRFGTVEQGAAGLGASFMWLFLVTCNCCGAGVNIYVAQYIGAKRHADCGAITWQGLYASGIAWLPMIAGGLLAPHLLQLSAPSPELVAPAALYLRIQLLGSLPSLCNFVLVSFFRGLGDTKTPLLVTLVVQLLNGLLDVLLIFGYAGLPRLGIAGSALATNIAALTGTMIYLWLFLRRGQREGFLARPRLPFDRQACRRLLHVSWPVGMHGMLELGAWTVFTISIARLGAVEAAAHAIAVQIMAMAYMSGYGVSVAATTLVGQYMGARNLLAARRSMVSSLVLIVCWMGGLGLGFFVGRYTLVGLFTTDAAVLQLGARLILFVALFQVFDGLTLVAMGVLRGAGETRWPMLAGLVINWGIFLPAAMLAIFTWQGGITGGWAAALFYVIILGVVMSRRALQGQWQHRALV